MNPPIIPKVSVAGDDEGSASVKKQEVEGKGCRNKRPGLTLLSPFTDPLRKKRTMSVSDVAATPPCFDPTKPLHIEDMKAQFLEPVKGFAKKQGSKKAAASNTVDLPPSNLNNIHHYVRSTWQHEYGQAWTKVQKVYFPYNLQGSHWVAIEIDFIKHTTTVYDSYIAFTSTSKLVKYLHPISDTLARVLYEMHFYDAFEVEGVKQKGMKMSMFTPFTVCSIGDVPQQQDGKLCEFSAV
ncbi:hypothetical protein GBA52_024914 [Prunus armeniaca]|nr:hypothetical protein GBA52_024914 [Prunus armeniaca]